MVKARKEEKEGKEEGTNRRQLQRTIPSFSRIFEIFPLKKLQAPVPRFFFPRRQQRRRKLRGEAGRYLELIKIPSEPGPLSLSLFIRPSTVPLSDNSFVSRRDTPPRPEIKKIAR